MWTKRPHGPGLRQKVKKNRVVSVRVTGIDTPFSLALSNTRTSLRSGWALGWVRWLTITPLVRWVQAEPEGKRQPPPHKACGHGAPLTWLRAGPQAAHLAEDQGAKPRGQALRGPGQVGLSPKDLRGGQREAQRLMSQLPWHLRWDGAWWRTAGSAHTPKKRNTV